MKYFIFTTIGSALWSLLGICHANPSHQLIHWVLEHQHGASFDFSKQRILDWEEDGRLGVVAQREIVNGEILATIPWSAILSPTTTATAMANDKTPTDHLAAFHCGLARRLELEIRLGQESHWSPYLQHLDSYFNSNNNNKLPSQYSDNAKVLLVEILGGEDSKLIIDKPVHYVVWDWNVLCGAATTHNDNDDNDNNKKESRQMGIQAATWVQQHAFQDLMIPLKDLYTHRNGKYNNVDVIVVDGVHAQIIARRDIQQGEQLHTSYSDCETCRKGNQNGHYGTPEIFRDHGIIESMPQLWAVAEPKTRIPLYTDIEGGQASEMLVDGLKLYFRLDEGPMGEINVEFLWDDLDPVFYPVYDALFRERIRELHRLKNVQYSLPADAYDIDENEWSTIWKFHKAYSTALKHALGTLHTIMISENIPLGAGNGSALGQEQGFCRVVEQWEDHYTDFQIELDQVAYAQGNCKSSELVDFVAYHQLEVERTNYQEMRWHYRSEDDDTCLHLDSMLQICSSYRPHYHEFFVHFPARYVKSIRRVIFLGAGDAMLLHEILKYPSLEKVVGLELDQTITRKSFQYFKTQPHYDDPRVEWWYGDATKTLPLLPRDYWGSFDLVLVDLSETVVSLNVARKHDVLDVIAMLLKPDGVLLENELYLERMIRHFDHTVQLFYGSPKICVQVHTMSSNHVDFLRSPIYNHGVDMFLIDPVETITDRFKFLHDYTLADPIAQGKCDDPFLNATSTEYGRKAGIFMVLEAENCSSELLDDDVSLQDVMYRILMEQGLSPLSSPQSKTKTSSLSNSKSIQIIMKEGYIVARIWDEFKYVGFDLHFWGAFSRMEAVRDALADELQAETRSSYRVVVGGMHGSTTWEQDKNEIGVRFSQNRNCTPPDLSRRELQHREAIQVALDESLQLLQDPSDLVVLVACGAEDKPEECLSLQMLQNNVQVDQIIPFFACPDLPYFNNGSYAFEPMYQCERDIIDRLLSLDDDDDLSFDAFVVDLSAPLSMLQIFASVWTIPAHRDDWLAWPHHVVAVPFIPHEPQRQRFVDHFRRLDHDTVTTMAEFQLQGAPDSKSEGDSLGWAVLTMGDQDALYSLSQMEDRLRERLPKTDIQIRSMNGGQLHRPEDLLLVERSFRPDDYDYGPNAKQKAEQRPLGRQTIFQLETTTTHNGSITIPEMLVMTLEKTWEAMVDGDQDGNSTRRGQPSALERIETWTGVGDGVVVTSSFTNGSVVFVWDGAEHVDVNLFSLGDSSRDLADQFLYLFLLQTEWKPILRDDQPRGFGRVVNFERENDGNQVP